MTISIVLGIGEEETNLLGLEGADDRGDVVEAIHRLVLLADLLDAEVGLGRHFAQRWVHVNNDEH